MAGFKYRIIKQTDFYGKDSYKVQMSYRIFPFTYGWEDTHLQPFMTLEGAKTRMEYLKWLDEDHTVVIVEDK